jgi:hypothetical protein
MRWKRPEKSPLKEALSNSLERRNKAQHPVARVHPEAKPNSNPVARVAPSVTTLHEIKQNTGKEELQQLVAMQLERLQLQEECLSKLQKG